LLFLVIQCRSTFSRVLRFPTSGLGPMLFGKLLPAWARLGPLSTSSALRLRSHRRFPASRSRGRSPKMGWRSGFPTGRPWDFALDRGLLRDRPRLRDADLADLPRSPGPVPRIAGPSPHLQCSSGPMGPTLRWSRDSLPWGDSVLHRSPFGERRISSRHWRRL
jgi:hypothetical protein